MRIDPASDLTTIEKLPVGAFFVVGHPGEPFEEEAMVVLPNCQYRMAAKTKWGSTVFQAARDWVVRQVDFARESPTVLFTAPIDIKENDEIWLNVTGGKWEPLSIVRDGRQVWHSEG